MEVSLWCAPEPHLLAPALAARYETLLDAGEHERWQRLQLPQDRQRFLLARALVRTVLGTYCGREPQTLRFATNAWGKPALRADDFDGLVPHFNLSHTRGMAVLAVSRQAAVGVDVEHAQREVAAEALTARFFAPEELQALQGLPEASRHAYFFQLWTLKEAYVKALGLGLRIPLDSFVFDLDGEQIHCERREAGAPPLRFRSLEVAPHFRIGVAVASTLDPKLTCFRGLPFEGFVRQP